MRPAQIIQYSYLELALKKSTHTYSRVAASINTYNTAKKNPHPVRGAKPDGDTMMYELLYIDTYDQAVNPVSYFIDFYNFI
jgi:hypothetical protein